MEGNTSGVDDSEVIAEGGEKFYEAFVQDGGLCMGIGALLAGHTRGTRGRHGLGAITFGLTPVAAAIFTAGLAFAFAFAFAASFHILRNRKDKVI